MIKAIDLVMSLRYLLGDMQGLNVSDYELLPLINRAVSTLYGHLSQRYVHAAIKRKEGISIDPDAEDGSGDLREYELPGGFVRIHQATGVFDDTHRKRVLVPSSTSPPVEGSYRIVGTTFYAPKGTYSLEYYYIPNRVYELDGVIDAQESLSSWIEQIAVGLYRQNYELVSSLCMQCESVMAGREISHFENTMPTQILGGRV